MKTKHNETLMKKAVNYYQQGNSLQETADAFHIGKSTFSRYMRKKRIPRRTMKEGVALSHQKTRKSPDLETIKKLYLKEKWSCSKIGKAFGVSSGSIHFHLRRAGIKTRGKNESFVESHKGCKRENNSHWKGGRYKTQRGYIKVLMPGHRRADKNGYVMESILIWEQHYKKALSDDWVVHHINGKKDDNQIENLEAMAIKKHCSLHGQKFYPKRKKVKGPDGKFIGYKKRMGGGR